MAATTRAAQGRRGNQAERPGAPPLPAHAPRTGGSKATVRLQDTCERVWKSSLKTSKITNMDWSAAAYQAAALAAGVLDDAPEKVRRQARWDREHIRTASTRLEIKDAARLKAACAAAGVSMYQLIRYMILVFLAGWEAGQEERKAHGRTARRHRGNDRLGTEDA